MRQRKSCVLWICRMLDTMSALTIASFYRHEYTESTVCPKCGVSRYKKNKKAPRKTVWYFPITPHLQRYFADPKQAKLMRWHAERKQQKEEAEKMIQIKT